MTRTRNSGVLMVLRLVMAFVIGLAAMHVLQRGGNGQALEAGANERERLPRNGQSRKADKTGEKTEHTRSSGRSAAEWTSLAISTTIVLALVGLVVYQHLTGGTEAAVIEVRPQIGAIRHEGDAYYVPFEVANRGDLTAEELRVQVVLAGDQGPREVSEVTIQFLAGGARARGTAVFREDPSQATLTTRVVSYLEP